MSWTSGSCLSCHCFYPSFIVLSLVRGGTGIRGAKSRARIWQQVYHMGKLSVRAIREATELVVWKVLFTSRSTAGSSMVGLTSHRLLAKDETADDRRGQETKATYYNGQGSHNRTPRIATTLQFPASGLTLDILFKPKECNHGWEYKGGIVHITIT